jgi:magnesium chelatase subunit D
VNLLADSLTDALLDVASSGRHYIERDGLSAAAEARFVLLGSMNIEEGALRPQLLDRFALALDVAAPLAIEERASIAAARLRFDSDPVGFCAAFETEQQQLRQTIAMARSLAADIPVDAGALREIASAVTDAGVRSLRADLAALRAAVACAALNGRREILTEDLVSVMPLVLHHRTRRDTPRPPEPQISTEKSSSEKPPDRSQRESAEASSSAQDRVFPPLSQQAPELRTRIAESKLRGRSAQLSEKAAAASLPPGKSAENGALDVVASLKQAFRNTGAAELHADHLAFREPRATSGIRFIFVVDSSGSHAAQQRMRAVKGAAAALLESSLDRKDEVAVISFRGPKAEIVLEPCRDVEAALRALEFLPTGGRTPLAHALELARSLVTSPALLILLTDGRANVPLSSGDPWKDALDAAGRLHCASVLIDSSLDSSSTNTTNALASAMQARWIRLDELSGETLLNIVRP